MFCLGILVAVQTKIFSVDLFRQMVGLYSMCKGVLFSGTKFQLWLLRFGIIFIFLLGFRCWCIPWRVVFWLSLEAVNEICKMKEVGHGLCSGLGFITKWSNRKVNAFWNLRASFVDTDTVMRRSLTGHWLNICLIGFHEKRDDNVSTWISSWIEVRVAFDFFSHYVDVKLISVYLSMKSFLFNRDHVFNDSVNSRKNTLEITLKTCHFLQLTTA